MQVSQGGATGRLTCVLGGDTGKYRCQERAGRNSSPEMSIMWVFVFVFVVVVVVVVWLEWNLVAACRLSLVVVSRGCSLHANAQASHCYGFPCRSQAQQLWCLSLS